MGVGYGMASKTTAQDEIWGSSRGGDLGEEKLQTPSKTFNEGVGGLCVFMCVCVFFCFAFLAFWECVLDDFG